MASHIIPHFQNDCGLEKIEIGVKRFMCIGATPPFDHPHSFIELGDENEKICPYCSTLYLYNPKLGPYETIPANCLYRNEQQVA